MLEITITQLTIAFVVLALTVLALVTWNVAQARQLYTKRTGVEPVLRCLALYPPEPGIQQGQEIDLVSEAAYDAGVPIQFCTDNCTLERLHRLMTRKNLRFNMVIFGGHHRTGITQFDAPSENGKQTNGNGRDLTFQDGRKLLVDDGDLIDALRQHQIRLVLMNACLSEDTARHIAGAGMIAIGWDKEVDGDIAASFAGFFCQHIMLEHRDEWEAFAGANDDIRYKFPLRWKKARSYIYPQSPPYASRGEQR